MMIVKNLTPHAINVMSPEGAKVATFPPSGQVARCKVAATSAGATIDGIILTRTEYGEVEGLPAPEEGVILLVSALVRAALPGRKDLASPGELFRDVEGQPVGCKGLVVN